MKLKVNIWFYLQLINDLCFMNNIIRDVNFPICFQESLFTEFNFSICAHLLLIWGATHHAGIIALYERFHFYVICSVLFKKFKNVLTIAYREL